MTLTPRSIPSAPALAERVRPICLPRLSRSSAQAGRRLARPRLPLPLPGNEAFHLIPVECQPHNSGEAILNVALRAGHALFTATLPATLLLGPIRALDAGLRLDPLPPSDLLALLAEAALLPLVDAFARGTGEVVSIEGVTPAPSRECSDGGSSDPSDADPAGTGDTVTLPIALHGPGLERGLTLCGTRDGLDALLRGWATTSRPLLGLRVAAGLQIGATDLPLHVARSLRVGDAVLIEHLVGSGHAGEAASVRHLVVADTLGAPVAVTVSADVATATLLGPLTTLVAPSRSAGRPVSQKSDPASVAHSIDDIPVRLVFEAGRLELSVGELRELAAGSVLPFAAAAQTLGRVQILVGTQRIGVGELVDIDGQPGVRIVAFAKDIDSAPTGTSTGPESEGAAAAPE